jgi:hypothetical protein
VALRSQPPLGRGSGSSDGGSARWSSSCGAGGPEPLGLPPVGLAAAQTTGAAWTGNGQPATAAEAEAMAAGPLPRSEAALEAEGQPGYWACMQVTDLRHGP